MLGKHRSESLSSGLPCSRSPSEHGIQQRLLVCFGNRRARAMWSHQFRRIGGVVEQTRKVAGFVEQSRFARAVRNEKATATDVSRIPDRRINRLAEFSGAK